MAKGQTQVSFCSTNEIQYQILVVLSSFAFFLDKMGGGDLDGDRFLIVWDHRLIKYRNKIQAYEAQDYDVDSSGNERKRVMVVPSDDQKNNSDWIHAVAMLDSVMLGAIENSYYALAKVRINTELHSRLNHHMSHSLFLYIID